MSHIKLKCHKLPGSLPSTWEPGFTAEKSVQLASFRLRRPDIFCNRILETTSSVVSELLRHHKAKPFNRCQEPSYLGPPWQDLPRNSVSSSAGLSTAPTSRLSKREGRIHWEGEGIFYGKGLLVCCIFQHTPTLPWRGHRSSFLTWKNEKPEQCEPQRTI